MWKVYKLVNVSLSECFVGVTEGDPHAGLKEAANGEVEVIDHWDAEEHRILLEVLKTFDSEMMAVEYLGDRAAKDGCLKVL